MIYDSVQSGDGVWHCPYPEQWVERMKRAAKRCEKVNSDVEAEDTESFLIEPQDVRGLPLSYCEEEERRYSRLASFGTAIYDYASIPDCIITNGEDDWPLKIWNTVQTA